MNLFLNFSFLALIFTAWLPSEVSALNIPELTAPVMDEAGVIGGRAAQFLDHLLREANAREKIQLTILTLPSLDGEPIEQATIKIVDKWKLGKKGKDNGVLFLVVPAERKARIEVGQGLEGDLPDVVAKRILADIARPYFKKGLYADGILAGTVQILKRADPEFSIEGYSQQPSAESKQEQLPSWAQILILIALIVIVIFGRFLGFIGGGFGGGGWGGGSGGGGWSGGGGGFSGGGSSDSW